MDLVGCWWKAKQPAHHEGMRAVGREIGLRPEAGRALQVRVFAPPLEPVSDPDSERTTGAQERTALPQAKTQGG